MKQIKEQAPKTHKSLLAYAARRWPMYLGVLVSLVLVTGLDAVLPQITKRIVDDVILGGQLELAWRLLIALLVIGGARGIFGYLKEFTSDKLGVIIGRDMRKDLFHHIQSLDMGFFHKNNTGELMARVKDDVDRVWFIMGFGGGLIVEAVVHTILTIICMVQINPLLTVLPIIVMTFVGFVAVKMERRLDKCYDELSEENAELTTVAQENLSGVRTVKAFSREGFEIEKFTQHNQKYYDINMNLNRAYIKHYPWISFGTRLLLILVIVFGGFMVIFAEGDSPVTQFLTRFGSAGMTLGGLTAYVEYANGIIWPMEVLGWLSNEVASAVASNRKLKKIYEASSSIVDPEQPVVLEKVEGNIEFDHVGLEIDGSRILEDVCFTLEKGRTLGIMGMTGSGKSTIVNLIDRFYDVTEGAVKLDGVDVRELSLAQVRESTAVVMQDVFLFSDSIRENIAMGRRSEITDDDLERAADSAMASEFINELDERFETIIGERGVGLSGGQKQRISIARALAKDTPILVLDDATSALDMETEYEFQQALAKLEDTTKIIIAHRISAVKDADEIIMLSEGRIAERGTHKELMAKRGLYFDVYVAQYNTETDMAETAEAF